MDIGRGKRKVLGSLPQVNMVRTLIKFTRTRDTQ